MTAWAVPNVQSAQVGQCSHSEPGHQPLLVTADPPHPEEVPHCRLGVAKLSAFSELPKKEVVGHLQENHRLSPADHSTDSPARSCDSSVSLEELFSNERLAWILCTANVCLRKPVVPAPPGLESVFDTRQSSPEFPRASGEAAPAIEGNGRPEPVFFAMKLLLSRRDAGCIIGEYGSRIQSIQERTRTRMRLSRRTEFYPTTSLQDLNIQGPAFAAVVEALQFSLEAVVAKRGAVRSGEATVSYGKTHLKLVLPIIVAQSLVSDTCTGKGVRSLATVSLQVEHKQRNEGPSPQEVVVQLSGAIKGVNSAIVIIAEHLSCYARAPWFSAWATLSRCVMTVPRDVDQLAESQSSGLAWQQPSQQHVRLTAHSRLAASTRERRLQALARNVVQARLHMQLVQTSA